MSGSIISSSVSVTAGDIAKAVYGLTKQQLTTQRDRISAEATAKYDEISAEVRAWFDDKVASIERSDKYVESLALLNHMKCVLEISNYPALAYSIGSFPGEAIHGAWLRTATWFDYRDGKGSFVLNKLAKEVGVTLIFKIDGADDYALLEWIELFSVPLETINTSELIAAITPAIEQYIELRNEATRLSGIVKGDVDPDSNMTLEERVTNTITLKAVENMPGLKETFDALAISSSLISGYLK